jgi:hypothetical protein
MLTPMIGGQELKLPPTFRPQQAPTHQIGVCIFMLLKLTIFLSVSTFCPNFFFLSPMIHLIKEFMDGNFLG